MRLPRTHGNPRRPQGIERPPRPRSQASGPLAQFPMRLTARQRLRRTSQFQAVRADGERVQNHAFILQIRLTPQEEGRRLGVIASRRVGGAVQRNRCKRLLREAFRHNQDQLPVGCDLVLVARREMLSLGFEEINELFQRALGRVMKRLHASRDDKGS